MHPTRRWGAVLAVAAALTLGVAGPVAADEPTPVVDPAPEGSFVVPGHIWVDPTHPNSDGDIVFTADFVFPVPTTHWVAHGVAPRLVETGGVVHCGLVKKDFGATLSCEGRGTPRPSEGTLTVGVRSEADGDTPGVNFEVSAPYTVCPLTGCSPLFELSLAEDTLEVCAGADLAEAPLNSYVFNVAWNAELTEIGDFSSDPGGDWSFVTGPPADGSAFGFEGSFATPGDYTLPITLTDEFGTPHTADLEVVVDGCSAPALAATGSTTDPLNGMLALAVGFSVAGILAVVIAACATRRRTGLGA